MPSIFESIPRDAFEANAYLGERAERGIPGRMSLVRQGRVIELRYRGDRICRWYSDGTLRVFRPDLSPRSYGRYPPTRALFSRIAQVLPREWDLEDRGRNTSGRPRHPHLLYREVYRLPLETDVWFDPRGSIRTSATAIYGETSRADLDRVVEGELAGRRRQRPQPEQPELPAWVGRGDPEPQPTARERAQRERREREREQVLAYAEDWPSEVSAAPIGTDNWATGRWATLVTAAQIDSIEFLERDFLERVTLDLEA